jgi:hypothetical protein
MGELAELAGPLQFATTGVTVYSQLPAGTESSVQLVDVTTPEHPALTVAGLPVLASYRAMT